MSDPPKKPGSLRDRIAAFENKGGASAPAPAPVPRPKPTGGASWKPRPRSPPSSPKSIDDAHGSDKGPGVMSAADAKASIGQGGSLRERMAALQGLGAFGGGPSPPKPVIEKPKWKPPPTIATPGTDEKDETREIDTPQEASTGAQHQVATDDQHAPEGQEGHADPGPEEEERQRRAAIAARMARLGGARVGMAPPVFGRKPEVKKAEVTKDDEKSRGSPEIVATVPAIVSPIAATSESVTSERSNVEETDDFVDKDVSSPSLLSSDSGASTAVRSAAMPVPVGPRRAAPPRKRAAKSPSPASTTVLAAEGTVNESPSSVPGLSTETPTLDSEAAFVASTNEVHEPHGDREPELRGSQVEALLENVDVTDITPTRKGEVQELLDQQLIPNVAQPMRAPGEADKVVEVPQSTPEVDVGDLKMEHADPTPHRSTGDVDEPSATEPSIPTVTPTDETGLPPPSGQPIGEEEEEDEDDTIRRKRIAERLAKTGGMNPLSGPPPPSPPPSSPPKSMTVERRHSLPKDEQHSDASPKSTTLERPPPVQRGSIGSVDSQFQLTSPEVPEASQSPPLLPVLPKLEELGRKSSIEFTRVEPPARKMSQDDHRRGQVHSRHALSFNEEPNEESATEITNRGREAEQHVRHGAINELRSVVEERPYETENENDGQLIPDGPSVPGEALAGGQVSDTVLSQEAMATEASVSPSYLGYHQDVPGTRLQQGLVPEPDTSSALPPLHSAKESLPSPTTLPSVPQDEPGEERHEAVLPLPPPPVRRYTRPLSHPKIVAEDIQFGSTRGEVRPERPVTYLEVGNDHLLEASHESAADCEPREYQGSEYEERNEKWDFEQQVEDVRVTNASRSEAIPQDSKASKELEIGDEKPPPPPWRGSVSVPPYSDYSDDDEAAQVEPSPVTSRSHSPPRLHEHRPRSKSGEQGNEGPLHSAPTAIVSTSRGGHIPPPLSKLSPRESEILNDSDVDPIDPAFYSPQKPAGVIPEFTSMPTTPPSTSPAPLTPPGESESEPDYTTGARAEDDLEQVRRHTIAERMAKLGGIRFGAPPPPPLRRTQNPTHSHPDTDKDRVEEPTSPAQLSEAQQAPEEEEDEFARKQRIAARIAGMGGMRFGMLPSTAAPSLQPQMQAAREQTDEPDKARSPPPQRSAPVPSAPAEPIHNEEQSGPEEDKAEESTHQLTEEAPPPVPSREGRRVSAIEPPRPPVPKTTRPPVPQITRPPVLTVPVSVVSPKSSRPESSEGGSSTHTEFSYPPPPPATRPPPVSHDTHGDYVIVEEADKPPPPPPRSVSIKRTHLPPPSAPPPPPPPPPTETHAAQLNTPGIPSVDFGGETDLSLSGQWSEDSAVYPPPPPAKSWPPRPSSQAPPERGGPSHLDVNLSADDLMAIWGRVGVQIHETASVLFEKSRKSLVGDGSYLGFVTAVLSQVPNAAQPAPPFETFGYLTYAQTGSAVQKRASDVMPGDVIVLQDAKFKGHKGLQIYHQTVGVGEPLFAIVSDYEMKKAKVKVFQANQHVGQQTVESASYRLEDLKSGSIKIFRVLEAR
ncbi:hypothetical protein AcW1_007558 [Taiwanofungus camphoratus]|nr:hypothetical protein AcV5_007721 [Antrodia cinnamomea]KAI0953307.1 hypothetical protein AcW1_007558 [Antrodia cinnamomea]